MSNNVDYATYSTEEKLVGRWIDGSPIYRKTYTGTVSVTANQRQNIVLESAATCEVDTLVNVGGYMTTGTGSYGKNAIPFSETNSSGTPTEWCEAYVVADTGELRAVRWSSNNRSGLRYAIWVEYTKR